MTTKSLVGIALFAFLLVPLMGHAQESQTSRTSDDLVTFSEHVAPIFFSKCTSCHQPDDVAPMSLLTFEEARPWARSIVRKTASREMPPWDANPRYGEFSNDISLSDGEIDLISRWVEQGAKEGDPAQLPEPPVRTTGWRMGSEPDLVIELAEIEVSASGDDRFITQVYGVDVPEGTWIQGIELLPGNTNVLHHVVTYLGPFGMDDSGNVIYLNEAAKRKPGLIEAPAIGGVWVAGAPPSKFRPGTGHTLKHDGLVTLNMHYHPNGTAGKDRSKLGFFFGEGELEKEITTAFAADPGILIPPGSKNHLEQAFFYFDQDSHIVSLLPHMHQRGKAMTYTLLRPDGSEEIILDVPDYDYDWQNIYLPKEPIEAPAGSVISVAARWDNSADNPANPDPSSEVDWGDGTNQEMLVAFVDFIVDEGKAPRGVRANEKIAALLDRHGDADHTYSISLEGMGFAGNWGLFLPEKGDGSFYVALGSLMFSSSIDDIARVGNRLVFNGDAITSAGGARMPVGFVAEVAPNGAISGEAFLGRGVSSTTAAGMAGTGQSFTGRSRSSNPSSSSAGAAQK